MPPVYFAAFRRSAHLFFIISEIRLRASGDIVLRLRLVRFPTAGASPAAVSPEAVTAAAARPRLPPGSFERSALACAVSVVRRSRVARISRSRPPMAQPIISADFNRMSPWFFLGRPRGIAILRNER